MSDKERRLREALVKANGSPSKAGELLGISRMTVWRRMKQYGIEIEVDKRVVSTLTRKPADPFRADVLRGERSKLDGDVS